MKKLVLTLPLFLAASCASYDEKDDSMDIVDLSLIHI